MKNLLYFFVLICFTFPINALKAQKMTAQERKAIELELRTLSKNPEKLKEIKADDQALQREITQRKMRVQDRYKMLTNYQNQLTTEENKLQGLRNQQWQLSNKLTSPTSQEVVFRVQIGAYRNARVAKALSENKNFFIEDAPIGQGVKRYIMGEFTSYWEAKSLSEKLNQSGAQAFVVGYLAGRRIENLKEMPQKYF